MLRNVFCQSSGECQEEHTLFALGPGDEKVRVTLRPDPGTGAGFSIYNALGGPAGPSVNDPSHGGLVEFRNVRIRDIKAPTGK